jgi:hypothetical protein
MEDGLGSNDPPVAPAPDGEPPAPLEARLERGEVVFYPHSPFPLPTGEGLRFLLRQRLGSAAHKNVSYNPATGRVGGVARRGAEEAARLGDVLAAFSRDVTQWLTRTLPRYRGAWRLDLVSYRPQEEATRRLRHTSRNDLLHVDAFPTRPTGGDRILRVFANINPSEPRIWVTSEPFARLLERYGEAVGLPGRSGPGWLVQLGAGVLRLFRPGRARRTAYDQFMLRFHDYLKLNDEFQERSPKRLWTFPPGSAWMTMTDACSHAVLRGRYALEHSYFIPESALARPDESPAALLKAACARVGEWRAA